MKQYEIRLQDGDGQPLTSWEAFGMKEVRERIATARIDWAHYAKLHFLVTTEADVCVMDRVYISRCTCNADRANREIGNHFGDCPLR